MIDVSLLQGESKYVEYKKDYTKSLLKTVSAFANYHDGSILIGLDDHGVILGVTDSDNVRLSIENAINDTLKPRPYYEIYEAMVEEKNVLILKVFKGDHTPYTVENKAYKRMDTSSVPVDRHAHEELILLGRNLSYETLPSEFDDLSFTILEDKLKRALNVNHISEDLLVTLGLKAKNQFNNVAALLSDTNPLLSSTIQLLVYNDSTVIGIKDRQSILNTSILKQFDICMEFYSKHMNVAEVISGPYRKTVEEIPLVAYREAIANAIVHRDYSRHVDLRVEFFSDRVEIISPGGLPVGISENEYLEGRVSIPRNRTLAEIFLRLGIIEKLATGIRRIKEYYQDYQVKPRFEVNENSIIVILPKIVLPEEESSSGKTGRIPEEYKLNKNEALVYSLLEKHGALDRATIEQELGLKKSQTFDLIDRLRELNLAAQIGKGRTTKYVLKQTNRKK